MPSSPSPPPSSNSPSPSARMNRSSLSSSPPSSPLSPIPPPLDPPSPRFHRSSLSPSPPLLLNSPPQSSSATPLTTLAEESSERPSSHPHPTLNGTYHGGSNTWTSSASPTHPQFATAAVALKSPRSETGRNLSVLLQSGDKNALVEHFQKEHSLVADGKPPLPSDSPTHLHHRVISDAQEVSSLVSAGGTRVGQNINTLKKMAKTVGKAAILIEMMKPQMITHKKGVKPANYDACKAILSKSPYLRTRRDCEALLLLVKNVKFFKNLAEEEQLELCKVMGHQDVAWARQTIMLQGDPGTTFYVILIGSVYVQINVSDSKNLKTVAHLHPGDSFGEAALISDKPRNATVVSAEPSELLSIEKEDYERVIKRLHVEALKKKSAFIRGIPAFETFPEWVVQDLASRVFFEKVPIYHTIWKQGDLVDPMKFCMLVRHGEVHAIKSFKVRAGPGDGKFKKKTEKEKEEEANRETEIEEDSNGGGVVSTDQPAVAAVLAKRRGILVSSFNTKKSVEDTLKALSGKRKEEDWVDKKVDLCILGQNGAFFERAMFGEIYSLEESILHEKSDLRGCSIVTGSACEVGWLSKHIFNGLSTSGSVTDSATMAQAGDAKYMHVLADLKEWMVEYPSEKELRKLLREHNLWNEYKQNVLNQACDLYVKKRTHARNQQQLVEDNVVETIRKAKYGSHPLKCDIVLPFRKPVDLLPMSMNTDIRMPEYGLAPPEFLYAHVDKGLTPRSLEEKVVFGTSSLGRRTQVAVQTMKDERERELERVGENEHFKKASTWTGKGGANARDDKKADNDSHNQKKDAEGTPRGACATLRTPVPPLSLPPSSGGVAYTSRTGRRQSVSVTPELVQSLTRRMSSSAPLAPSEHRQHRRTGHKRTVHLRRAEAELVKAETIQVMDVDL